ncbi:hypothetical protein [Roseovarius indicus]|uniref:Uncharacterized protein n=1 Tax=Roseovarius indicus TaxID=540747 RepID=A0A0T5PD43_9RHOB|nr:hypothetical protein [Roseovarius indicus]KRS18900.1 hypothetical protein XM52_04270 [Roseovarius indicus]QEW26173.1 hypothetical protein RIdsm_01970 [Roseovarius indicus]SFD94428.1 hypothetical protein SAMN04488031_103383 [Roseovarius indicus]
MDIVSLRAHADDGLPFRIKLESVNKGIGLAALLLPFALLFISALGNTCPGIDSISHYYYSRLGGDILVGTLCFIGLQMTFFYHLPAATGGREQAVDGYLGHNKWDIRAARFAGLCAFGVALMPTSGKGCEDYGGLVSRVFLKDSQGGHAVQSPDVPLEGTASFDFWPTFGINAEIFTMIHYAAAAGMFLVLAYYSLVVFTRPQSPASVSATGRSVANKRLRNLLYRIFGGLILVALGALLYKFIRYLGLDDPIGGFAGWNRANLTFWFETLGLVAFGLSWCLKGRLFGLLRDDPPPA